MQIETMTFTVLLVVALLGWLKNWLGLRTLVYFMQMKKYTPPSEQETKACTAAVIKRTFGRKGRTGI